MLGLRLTGGWWLGSSACVYVPLLCASSRGGEGQRICTIGNDRIKSWEGADWKCHPVPGTDYQMRNSSEVPRVMEARLVLRLSDKRDGSTPLLYEAQNSVYKGFLASDE